MKCIDAVSPIWEIRLFTPYSREKSFCFTLTDVMKMTMEILMMMIMIMMMMLLMIMMILMMLGGAVSFDQRQNIHLSLWIFPASFHAHGIDSLIHSSDFTMLYVYRVQCVSMRVPHECYYFVSAITRNATNFDTQLCM